MLNFISGILNEEEGGHSLAGLKADLVDAATAAATAATSSSATTSGLAGVCPISEDGRLVVCGFLGDNEKVKIPNSEKALPRVKAASLVEFLEKNHGTSVSHMYVTLGLGKWFVLIGSWIGFGLC